MAGRKLQSFLQYASHSKYEILTRDRVREAKSDLKEVLGGVAGAQSDNVAALVSLLDAAGDRDWSKVAILIPDAEIDYSTLMLEYRKGYRPIPRTIPSDRFAGIHDLRDIPNELVSVSLALKQPPKSDDPHPVKGDKPEDRELVTDERDKENTLRKQEAEIRRLRNRVNALTTERVADGLVATTGSPEESHAKELSEMYTSLYNEEWKQAVDFLHSKRKDQKGGNIKTCADILEASFQYCKKLATNQFQDMWEKMVYPMENVPEWVKVSQNIQKLASTKLKTFRKQTAACALPALQMTFTRRHLERILESDLHSEEVLNFAKKCIELCWFFNMEDPPMCLLWARDGQIISEHLTIYAGTGDVVYYNVWPALLLHEGGSLLSKGIVQPTSSKLAAIRAAADQ